MKPMSVFSIKNCFMTMFAVLLLSANASSQEKTVSPLLGEWKLGSVNYVIEKGGKVVEQKTYLPGQASQIPENYPKVFLKVYNYADKYLALLTGDVEKGENGEYNVKGEMTITGDSLKVITDDGFDLTYVFKKDKDRLELNCSKTLNNGNIIKQSSIYSKIN